MNPNLEIKTVLYIGGFELPDKNAAAQRVIGISKALRELGYRVVLLNALKDADIKGTEQKKYFDFECVEYKREPDRDYLFFAKTAIEKIQEIKPDIIIAYNYPAVALNRIVKYAKEKQIKCYADATEWPAPVGGNIVYKAVKQFDTFYRMRFVHKKTDGVISISRFLYEYYEKKVPTVIIPPTIDEKDEKWLGKIKNNTTRTTFVYAGSPSALKERLDIIVKAIKTTNSIHNDVVLKVVGVTDKQFISMFLWNEELPDNVLFLGRVSHRRAIDIVKESDWSIILRDNNRVVKAGFPTKLVESISC